MLGSEKMLTSAAKPESVCLGLFTFIPGASCINHAIAFFIRTTHGMRGKKEGQKKQKISKTE